MTERLGDHALLGDLHTIALVDSHGALDWLCLPRFDSTPCFAALTNGEQGGVWTISPTDGGRVARRRYRHGTLVLESEWDTPDGTVRVVDCMAPRVDGPCLVRLVEGVTGNVPVRVRYQPRFDHGERTPWLRCTGTNVSAVAGTDTVWLDASVPLEPARGGAEAVFTVAPGQRAGFVLTHTASHLPMPAAHDPVEVVEAAEKFWATWSARISETGPHEDVLLRAAITLRALTHAPSGAVVTTPVFRAGQQQHLCAVDEASSTLDALRVAGLEAEARAWREWLVRAIAGDPRQVATRYTIDGRGDPAARTGGAGALGGLLYAVNSADDLWLPSGDPSWDPQLDLLDHLESAWEQPDEDAVPLGHRVVSKVRAWAGLDRAVRTAERHGLPGPVGSWRATRSRLRAEVCAKGYDRDRNTFTSHYGSSSVDAELLVMPEVGFLPWRDVRIRGTVRAITSSLTATGSRPPDSLAPGTPLTTAFRLVTALHGTGHPVAATALFDRLMAARNDVGLLGECYDPTTRDIGLTPHAGSVAGVVNAARQLRAHRRRGTD